MRQHPPKTKLSESVDLLRMGEADLKTVLSILESMEDEGKGEVYRHSQRHNYQQKRILVQLQGMNNLTSVTYKMMPADISSSGICLVHGAFVYPGTSCVVTFNTLDAERVNVHGQIVRCRLITGRAHEIGVKFLDSIDLKHFIAAKREAS